MVAEISAKSYMKGVYEVFHALRRWKNKAKQSRSNPIKPNYIGANDGFVIPVETGYVFSRGKTIPKACGFEAATRLRDNKGDLKKQSQFDGGRN